MESIIVVSSLSPAARVAFMLGHSMLIFLLVSNCSTGINRVAFLHDLFASFQHKVWDIGRDSTIKRKEKRILQEIPGLHP